MMKNEMKNEKEIEMKGWFLNEMKWNQSNRTWQNIE
jgi:hypothetical protein